MSTHDPQAVEISSEPVGHGGTRVEVAERPCWAISGWAPAILAIVVMAAMSLLFALAVVWYAPQGGGPMVALAAVVFGLVVLGFILVFASLTVISPGQTRVVQFFGRYVGTCRTTGMVMLPPLTTRSNVSVRVRNFETTRLKVNDADGNPVDIAAIVVWQVADTAKAKFAVESYQNFLEVQSEAALRHVAGEHPYDDRGVDRTSLRGSTDVVAGQLAQEVATRAAVAGVEVVEVRISHLAYSQEIAQAMLQRQQASAVVAARATIVEGAVGMVEMALSKLRSQQIVELDDERTAAMVSNLLVVLCGESRTTPVVNTGSLYS